METLRTVYLRDFRLPARCSWIPLSCGMLCSRTRCHQLPTYVA